MAWSQGYVKQVAGWFSCKPIGSVLRRRLTSDCLPVTMPGASLAAGFYLVEGLRSYAGASRTAKFTANTTDGMTFAPWRRLRCRRFRDVLFATGEVLPGAMAGTRESRFPQLRPA